MRPLLHPTLVNGRSGDPALYIETLFDKRALLFDLGDIAALPARKILRLEQVFVSHAHIDHFVGFDRLLRLHVGREKQISLYGPAGFIAQVGHKLHGYAWNLAESYACDLALVVTEIDAALATRTVRFRLKRTFAAEEVGRGRLADDVVHSESTFRVSTAVLDHGIAVLGFALEEAARG
jgi:ribonuclease Z